MTLNVLEAMNHKRIAILFAFSCLALACAEEATTASGQCPDGTSAQETVTAADVTDSWCMARDGSTHGPFARTNAAGLVERGTYEHGAKAALWEYFHPDGQTPRLEGHYTNGVVDGAWRAFDETGRVTAHRWYRLALPCGIWETLIDGEIVSTTQMGACDLASVGQANEYAPPAVVDALDCPASTSLRRGMDDMWCEFPDGRAHGPYQRVYESGALAEHGSYDGGKAHGLWQEFSGIGLPLRIDNFENGKLSGESKAFYTSGAQQALGAYVNDTRHGEWTLHYYSGVTEWEGAYDHGMRQGLWKGYTPRGEIGNEGSYDQDYPVGTWTEYFHTPNGSQRLTGPYVSGVRHGRWEGFDEDDNLIFVVTYNRGHVYGDWLEYWPNGNLKAEGRMEFEYPVGLWKEYYEDGAPRAEGEYSPLGQKIGVWTTWDEDGTERQVNYG